MHMPLNLAAVEDYLGGLLLFLKWPSALRNELHKVFMVFVSSLSVSESRKLVVLRHRNWLLIWKEDCFISV